MKPYSPAHTYFKLVLLHQPQCIHSQLEQFICPLGLQAEKHNHSQQSQKTAAQCAPHQGDGHLLSSHGRPPQPSPAASAGVQQKALGKPWDCYSWIHRSKNQAQRVWDSALMGTQGCWRGQRRADQSLLSPSPCFWQTGIS